MKMQDSIKIFQARLMPALENEVLVQQYAGWLLQKLTVERQRQIYCCTVLN